MLKKWLFRKERKAVNKEIDYWHQCLKAADDKKASYVGDGTCTTYHLSWNKQGGKFEIFRPNKGKYYFRLLSKNGRIIAASQGYKSKKACQTGINAIRKLAVNADIIDISGDRKR